MRLVRHTYGPEGSGYIRSYLASNEAFGKRLGALLAPRDVAAGTTWAFVPAGSAPRQRLAFDDGGLFPPETSGVQKAEMKSWLGARLADPALAPSVLCIEEAYTRRTGIKSTDLPHLDFMFCGSDPYWYATDEKLRGLSSEWIPLMGGLGSPDIGIVTTLPASLSGLVNRQSVPVTVLESMAASAVAVVVGAWDFEGIMVWEPADDTAAGDRDSLH